MTFSDAEEDQPTGMQNGTASPPGATASPTSTNAIDGPSDDGQGAPSSSSIKADDGPPPSDGPIISHTQNSNPPPVRSPCSSGAPSSNNPIQNGVSASSSPPQINGVEEPTQSRASDEGSSSVSNEAAATSEDRGNPSLADLAENNLKGIEAEKVMEKLQQIHGYIQQTASAMQALEQEGNLNKIGQYNTLVKCMRDLKKSEANLTSHLDKLKAKALASERGSSGSESIGVVGNLTEEGGRPSMQERLSYHESEQQQLSARLRESLVRREELMARYQATRERLNNLKRQRLGIVHEERRLLQSVGAPDSPYDDPIPGAETWTILQLENAIKDFQGLRDKVDRLHEAYTSKLQAIDESDTDALSDLQSKMTQIANKKLQIGNALTHMTGLIQAKREREEAEASLSNLQGQEGQSASNDGDPALPEPAPVPETAPVSPPSPGPALAPASTPSSAPASASATSSERVVASPSENHNPRLASESEVTGPAEVIGEPGGALGMSPGAKDLLAKQRHLQSLKDQLSTMKRLLQVTQDSASFSNYDGDTSGQDAPLDNQGSTGGDEEVLESEPLVDSTIIGVNGEVIHLSEIERRNPQVVSKYQQLSEAKRRLAKMEEVMLKIAEARQSGKPLVDVLSPENMAILNEAREEEENEEPEEQDSVQRNQIHPMERNSDSRRSSSEVVGRSQRLIREPMVIQSPRRNPGPFLAQESASNVRPELERERDLSAMQYQLNKKSSGIPSVNEGFKVAREKGAIKKQTRNLLKENGGDPRLMEVIALQEELKEKKNALEALMKRMGKSSSFTLDNISDNLSENVSDANSDAGDKASASWGGVPFQGHISSQLQSDEELLDITEHEVLSSYRSDASALPRGARSSLPPLSSSSYAKNKNRNSPMKQQQRLRNPDPNQFSVNNLAGHNLKGVRPKHNRYPSPNVPVASWENVTTQPPSGQTHISSNKVQNTVASALSQLNLVQETINSLYGELRAADATYRQQEVPAPNPYGNNVIFPQTPFNTAPQNVLTNYSPLPTSQGRADMGTSNQILAGLQQCFSQLYLHSLEIQSLSKHLQIIDQREKSLSPSHTRGETHLEASAERRSAGDRHSAGRRVNESAPQNVQGRFDAEFPCDPSPRYEDRSKEPHHGQRQECRNHRGSDAPRPRNGVSNPLYGRLFNAQLRSSSSSWLAEAEEELEMEFGNKNFFPPFEGSASDEVQHHSNGDLLLDSSSHYPLDADEIPQDVPWSSGPILHPRHPPSSDILNNQVLPGSRANNYWDNFRSYSRQNPLSTTAKCNTGEQVLVAGGSSSGRAHGLNTGARSQQSMGFENKNRHYNLTSVCTNNSINKASDKNSSSSRSQNEGGARARYGQLRPGRKPPAASNPCYQRNVAPSPVQGHENEDRKRNDRLRGRFFEESIHPSEGNPNYHGDANSSDQVCSPSFPLPNNSRRVTRERVDSASHNSEENFNDFSVAQNASNTELQNTTTSHEDLSTSETFGQVVREAESLMQKHSQQPQFLLQLFHHASKITSNTDQQVALELLRELSYQRHQNNIQHNRWISNNSVAHSDNISLPAKMRESKCRNTSRFPNKNSRTVRDISCSDASESGITSDEEDTKALYQMMKNLTPTSSSIGVYPPRSSSQAFSEPANNPSSLGVSPSHAPNSLASNSLAPNERLLPESHKDFSKDIMNIVTPASNKERTKAEGNRPLRMRQEVASPCNTAVTGGATKSNSQFSLACHQVPRSASPPHKYDNRKHRRKSPGRGLPEPSEEAFNSPLKYTRRNLNCKQASSGPANQEPVSGFEAIVSSSVREVLVCFESAECSLASTPLILDNLLNSIMKQVQFHSSSLGFSSNFVSSIHSQLRATFRGFCGKPLPAIRQELAGAVTQVLIQEYCSLYMQQDHHLPYARRAQTQDSNSISDSQPANRATYELVKEPHVSPVVKQQATVSNSLSAMQDLVLKRPANSACSWAFNPSLHSDTGQRNPGEGVLAPAMHHREEDFKYEASNPKGKGAISKKVGGPTIASGSNRPEDSFGSSRDGPNHLPRQSPQPENFTESWVLQRRNSNASEGEGLYSLPESSFMGDRDDRELLEVFESGKQDHNDAEADQADHGRSSDFLSLSLPVHDLAEADQSQDPIEASGAIENDLYEATPPPYPMVLPEPKEFPLRVMTNFLAKKKEIPEQGLDEFPTRLLSAEGEGISSPPPPTLNGAHSTDEVNEGKMTPHRYGPLPTHGAAPSSQLASEGPRGESNGVSHGAESSSGKETG